MKYLSFVNLHLDRIEEHDNLKVISRGGLMGKCIGAGYSSMSEADGYVVRADMKDGVPDPKIHFRTLEQAHAFYNFIIEQLSSDSDKIITIDVLEHGAL